MTIPLPSLKHTTGVTACPHCSKSIGLDYRCPHLADLLTPAENGGVWAVVVREEPFEIPVLKKTKERYPRQCIKPVKRRGDTTQMDEVRRALVISRGTVQDVRERIQGNKVTVRMTLHRLWSTGEASIVETVLSDKGRRMYVYALTAKGKSRAREAARGEQRMAG